MFTLAYNTNGLRTMPFREAVEKLSAAGFEGIEIALQEEHFTNLDVSLSELAQIKKLLRAYDLKPVCIATGGKHLLSLVDFEPSLVCSSETGRRERIDFIKDSCDIANELEVPVVNFASGFNMTDERISMDYLFEAVCELADYAKEEGVILALEPEPGMFIETTKQACELIRKAGRDNFLLNMDIGHIECCEDDLYASVEEAVGLAAHIHIENIKNKVHHHELPGDGDIDMERVLRIINNSGYNAAVSVELYDHAHIADDAIKESYEFLSGIISKISS